MVDSIPERLKKAQELGAVPVDFSKSDPVEQIFNLRKKNGGIQQRLRPGEEKMKGVDCGIDAVGYQARDNESPAKEKPTQVLENCLKVVNATGHVGSASILLPIPARKAKKRKTVSTSFPLPTSLTRESLWAAAKRR